MTDPTPPTRPATAGLTRAEPDQAEGALLTAVRAAGEGGARLRLRIDPVRLRARAAGRRRTRHVFGGIVGSATALACLIAVVAAGPHVVNRRQGVAAGPAPAATASSTPSMLGPTPSPLGMRTEYYRDIAFDVPDSWGHAFAPGTDWCIGARDGHPPERLRKPYVSLGPQRYYRTVMCGLLPPSMATEHVIAVEVDDTTWRPFMTQEQWDKAVRDGNFETDPDGPDVIPPPPEGTSRWGDFWIVRRTVGEISLEVTTPSRDLGEQIVASAVQVGLPSTAGPCAAIYSSAPKPGSRTDLLNLVGHGGARTVDVCQYEQPRDEGDFELRGHRRVEGSSAGELVQQLTAAPDLVRRGCAPATRVDKDLLVTVHIQSADGTMTGVTIDVSSCPGGSKETIGGIVTDGPTYALTKSVCHAVLQPPLQLDVAGAAVAAICPMGGGR